MTQYSLAFLALCCLLISGTASADPQSSSRQNIETSFANGLICLKQHDVTCAQIELAAMAPASPYTKILEAGIAANQQAFDTVLRLLIPLQANTALSPQANASLHATLAQAYKSRGNALHALIQRSLAGRYLSLPEEIDANLQASWQGLNKMPRGALLEMRGESPNSTVQGWIDLALALNHTEPSAPAIEQWRSAYGAHPAGKLLPQIVATAPADAPLPVAIPKQNKTTIALLLPLEIPAFSNASYAVKAGLLAAIEAAQAPVEIKIYPTQGDRSSTTLLYQRAIEDGAQYVIGPLTRGEVSALESTDMIRVPTVALNTLESLTIPTGKLALFGLPVEEEARQLALLARRIGMQSASMVVADTPLAQRMAETFASEWEAQDGKIVQQIAFSATSTLSELRTKMFENPSDMIFLAANADQARLVRPFLDPATPTFGLSHLYDGDPSNPLNKALTAVHFVDMPWLINPEHPDYAPYAEAAAALPPGEAQRWFAVGVDSWRILTALTDSNSTSQQWQGLTGNILLQNGRISRTLPLVQFRNGGVFMEQLP